MNSKKLVYESPDGGDTIYARPIGSGIDQRVLIRPGVFQKEIKHNELWHSIHTAAKQDTHLKEMLDQIEVYYHLKNSP